MSLRLSIGQLHIITLITFMCGDIEKNPGPFDTAGIIPASFN